MSTPLRVGVVGCGEVAQLMHLPVLHELPNTRIEALCDVSQATLDAVGERYDVQNRVLDHRLMLERDEVDAVLVSTYDHASVVADVLAAGRHVLVEKPLTFLPGEAEPLVAAASEAGVVAEVGYMKLYDPGFEHASGLLAAWDEPARSVTLHNFAGRFDRHPALYDLARSGSGPAGDGPEARIAAELGPGHEGHVGLYITLVMLGIHDLALLREVVGELAGVAWARAVNDGDGVLAVLERADGGLATLELGLGARYEWWDEWLSVHTLQRELRVEFPHPYLRQAATVVRVKEPEGSSPSERVTPVSHDSPFRREWQHFVSCVRGEEGPRTPLRDGLADLRLARSIVAALPPVPAS